MKKILKIIFIIFVVLIMLRVILGIIFLAIFGTKKSESKITRQFNDNYSLFEDATIELQEYQNIELKENNKKILIQINNQDYSSDNSKFQKSIELMEKLKLKYIIKYNNHISFVFTSMVGYSQDIVKTESIENYKWGHPVNIEKKIQGNWYYIEE